MKKKISDREGGGGGNDTFPKVFKALKKYSAYNSCPVIHAQVLSRSLRAKNANVQKACVY